MMIQMIIVVHMPLRLCQGVEQDCFVHNNIQHGLALLSHVGIFFLFIPFSTFSLSLSLSCSCLCVQSISAQTQRAESAAVAASIQRGSCESEEKNLEPINGPRQWTRERDTHRQAQEERERKEILKERARACVHVRYIRRLVEKKRTEREMCI